MPFLLKQILHLTTARKSGVMMAIDTVVVVVMLWASISLRLGEVYVPDLERVWIFFAAPAIVILSFAKMGMYRAVIHYIEIKALWTVFLSVSLATVFFGVLLLFVNPYGVPRSSIIIFWLALNVFVGGGRLWLRWVLSPNVRKGRSTNVVIYGAGEAGVQLLDIFRHSLDFFPVAFIDDDVNKVGREVAGLHVYRVEDMDSLIQGYDIRQVLLAIPSLDQGRKRILVDRLESYPVQVRILPSVSEIAHGKVQISDVRDVKVEDLLGRSSVSPDAALLEENVCGKNVMVTGAGGSIGAELCRQALKLKPSRLVLFERSEFSLYKIEQELSTKIFDSDLEIELVPILGSVVDHRRMKQVCDVFGIQTLYHAAAYKHVPLVEFNPIEGIQNNVFGTYHAARAAVDSTVERFVLISTDKAVRPTNVMGASKRLAELVLQAMAQETDSTCFCMVRFGNVLGSSGSVIPLFQKQIKDGGPVTVTHPEITRYFMTIPEAAQLVIQAGAMAKGGDVFVLDMGEPVKIDDLAKKMIHLSGLSVKDEANPEGDIEIKFTGLRPGEKLYEELLIGDNVIGSKHPLIMTADEEMLPMHELEEILDQLDQACREFNVDTIRKILLRSEVGYKPQCDIKDLTYPYVPLLDK